MTKGTGAVHSTKGAIVARACSDPGGINAHIAEVLREIKVRRAFIGGMIAVSVAILVRVFVD